MATRQVKLPIAALDSRLCDAGNKLSAVIKDDLTQIYDSLFLLKQHAMKVKSMYEQYAELSKTLTASLTEKGCIDEALNVRKTRHTMQADCKELIDIINIKITQLKEADDDASEAASLISFAASSQGDANSVFYQKTNITSDSYMQTTGTESNLLPNNDIEKDASNKKVERYLSSSNLTNNALASSSTEGAAPTSCENHGVYGVST